MLALLDHVHRQLTASLQHIDSSLGLWKKLEQRSLSPLLEITHTPCCYSLQIYQDCAIELIWDHYGSKNERRYRRTKYVHIYAMLTMQSAALHS
jgi:hypothetical protein